MGILFTTLYVTFSHLSPEFILPGIAPYRPLVWLFLLAVVAAVITVVGHSYPYRAPQNVLIAGFFGIILFSSAIQAGSAGMAAAFSNFVPSFAAFFLCAATVRRTGHLRFLTVSLAIVGLYQAICGIAAYHSGGASPFVYMWPPIEEQVQGQAVTRRVRGLGFLNDPNDFAQFLLVMLPLLWTAWRKRAVVRNVVLVLAPSALILWTILLTQSRGGLLGFGAIVLAALRKRLGNARSAVITVVLVGGVMASGAWQRGDISVHEDSAAGRVEAWGNGIAMWKSSPLWGVGFGKFGDHNEDEGGLTAHNSFVLCFAELGTLGYLLWLGLITAAMLDLSNLRKRLPVTEDLSRWATAIRLSLIAYLTTAWFLSRTYDMTLFVLLGMGVAIVRMAARESDQEIRIGFHRLASCTAGAACASVLLVYCTLWARLT